MFYISYKYSERPTQVVYEGFLTCSHVDIGVEEKSTWCLLSPNKKKCVSGNESENFNRGRHTYF